MTIAIIMPIFRNFVSFFNPLAFYLLEMQAAAHLPGLCMASIVHLSPDVEECPKIASQPLRFFLTSL
jgi:hypothetical protein